MSITNLPNPVCDHSKSMVDLSFKIKTTPDGKSYAIYNGSIMICSTAYVGKEEEEKEIEFLDDKQNPYAWAGQPVFGVYVTLRFKKSGRAPRVGNWLRAVAHTSYNVFCLTPSPRI